MFVDNVGRPNRWRWGCPAGDLTLDVEGESGVGQVISVSGLVNDVDGVEAHILVSRSDGDCLGRRCVVLDTGRREADPGGEGDLSSAIVAVIGDDTEPTSLIASPTLVALCESWFDVPVSRRVWHARLERWSLRVVNQDFEVLRSWRAPDEERAITGCRFDLHSEY